MQAARVVMRTSCPNDGERGQSGIGCVGDEGAVVAGGSERGQAAGRDPFAGREHRNAGRVRRDVPPIRDRRPSPPAGGLARRRTPRAAPAPAGAPPSMPRPVRRCAPSRGAARRFGPARPRRRRRSSGRRRASRSPRSCRGRPSRPDIRPRRDHARRRRRARPYRRAGRRAWPRRLPIRRRAAPRAPAARGPRPGAPGAASASRPPVCFTVSSPPYKGTSPATRSPTRSSRCLCPGTVKGRTAPCAPASRKESHASRSGASPRRPDWSVMQARPRAPARAAR
jgi:hypothetical protein